MYTRLPTADELSGSGYTLEDFEGEECTVWPENWQAVSLFGRLQTQWNVGMAGPTGLRYETVYPLIDRATSDPQVWDELLDDLQTLEFAALEAMSKKP